ncbi:MAG: hypothetical protein HWE34_06295 [Methylocystaceae bacterium]|nr:hypothetical protein [Methylocystaceae bacterium]
MIECLKGNVLCLVVLGFLLKGAFGQDVGFDLVIPMNPENFGSSQKQLEGPTGHIIEAVLRLSGNEISYRISTPSHGYNGFYKNRYTCVAPDSKVYYEYHNDFIESLPIHDTHWVSVYRRTGKKVVTKEDMAGLKVGIIYQEQALRSVIPKSGVIYDYHTDIFMHLKKLAIGRLDAVVVTDSNLQKVLSSNGEFSDLTFDPSRPLAVIPDRVMCHDTPRGHKVIELVNKALIKLGHGRENVKTEPQD